MDEKEIERAKKGGRENAPDHRSRREEERKRIRPRNEEESTE